MTFPSAWLQVFAAMCSWHVAQPKHRLFVSLPVLIFDQHLLVFAKSPVEREKEWGAGKEEGVYSETPHMKSAAVAKMPLG